MLAAPVRFLTGAFFIVWMADSLDNKNLCYRRSNQPVAIGIVILSGRVYRCITSRILAEIATLLTATY